MLFSYEGEKMENKIYKIAILGCENTHANAFLEFIKKGLYPDIEVVGIYSDEKEVCQQLHEEYGVPMMENYDSLVGQVDGIMVTARHGDNHYKYAKPYLSSGIPMFIDKPITIDVQEAETFMEEAKQHNVRLCGGSTCAYVLETQELANMVKEKKIGDCIGGNIICPLRVLEQYGGFYFYAQHLVQIMTEVFGTAVREVVAHQYGNEYTFIAKYNNFDVSATYGGINYYYLTVAGKNNIQSRLLTINDESFKHELEEMIRLLKGGQQAFSYEEFILPVYIMNAIQRSVKTGKWEKIK